MVLSQPFVARKGCVLGWGRNGAAVEGSHGRLDSKKASDHWGEHYLAPLAASLLRRESAIVNRTDSKPCKILEIKGCSGVPPFPIRVARSPLVLANFRFPIPASLSLFPLFLSLPPPPCTTACVVADLVRPPVLVILRVRTHSFELVFAELED